MKHKTIFLFFIAWSFFFHCSAQGFFNQDKAMIKKCIQQIALLNTYTAELKSGYKTVEDGIHLTHDIKNGEFNLHSLYYGSMEQVNPNIKKYPAAQQAIELYNKMTAARTAVYRQAEQSALFTAKELQYINGVYTNLFKAADGDMQELSDLTTDGKLKLTDDERLKRIDGVHERMVAKFKALASFNNHILTVLNGRKQQQQNAAQLKDLYGIP